MEPAPVSVINQNVSHPSVHMSLDGFIVAADGDLLGEMLLAVDEDICEDAAQDFTLRRSLPNLVDLVNTVKASVLKEFKKLIDE